MLALRKRGFTIPELAVSIAIFFMILAVFLSFFIVMMGLTRKGGFLVDASRGLDMTLEKVVSDLAAQMGGAFQIGVGFYTSDFAIYTDRSDGSPWEQPTSNIPSWANGVFDTSRGDVLCMKRLIPNEDDTLTLVQHVCWGLHTEGNSISVIRLERIERNGTPVVGIVCYDKLENENCLSEVANFSLVPQPLWKDIELRFKAIPLYKTLGQVLEIKGSTSNARDLSTISSYVGLVIVTTLGLPHFSSLSALHSGDYIRRAMRLRCSDPSCDIPLEQKKLIESYLRRKLALRFIGNY